MKYRYSIKVISTQLSLYNSPQSVPCMWSRSGCHLHTGMAIPFQQQPYSIAVFNIMLMVEGLELCWTIDAMCKSCSIQLSDWPLLNSTDILHANYKQSWRESLAPHTNTIYLEVVPWQNCWVSEVDILLPPYLLCWHCQRKLLVAVGQHFDLHLRNIASLNEELHV